MTESNTDLLAALRPALREPELLAKIGDGLRNGHPCVLRDAFDPDYAERVHASLDACRGWEEVEQLARAFQNFRYCLLPDRKHYTDVLRQHERMLDAEATKSFMSELSGVDCRGPADFNISYYRSGDYQLPHCDAGLGRTLSFVWHLSKGWRREWGGHFYWCSPPVNLVPTFNTLVLFRVTTSSYHFVCPVSPLATEKRLAISGWWTGEGAVPMHPTGTDWYRGPLDRIGEGAYVIG